MRLWLYCRRKILHDFDRTAEAKGIQKPVISKELALELSRIRPNEAKATRYKRCITINQFSIYLSQNGLESAKCFAPKPKKTFVPYIYTREETERILHIADNSVCDRITRDSLCFVMPALIRFLLCTGVRIGEALQIEDKDMDLVNNVFILRDTKNGKRGYCRLRNRCQMYWHSTSGIGNASIRAVSPTCFPHV